MPGDVIGALLRNIFNPAGRNPSKRANWVKSEINMSRHMPIMDRIKKHAPARRALLATHIGVSNTAQRMKAASALGEDGFALSYDRYSTLDCGAARLDEPRLDHVRIIIYEWRRT